MYVCECPSYQISDFGNECLYMCIYKVEMCRIIIYNVCMYVAIYNALLYIYMYIFDYTYARM